MHIISQTANSSLPFKNIAEPFRCNEAGFKGMLKIYALYYLIILKLIKTNCCELRNLEYNKN